MAGLTYGALCTGVQPYPAPDSNQLHSGQGRLRKPATSHTHTLHQGFAKSFQNVHVPMSSRHWLDGGLNTVGGLPDATGEWRRQTASCSRARFAQR